MQCVVVVSRSSNPHTSFFLTISAQAQIISQHRHNATNFGKIVSWLPVGHALRNMSTVFQVPCHIQAFRSVWCLAQHNKAFWSGFAYRCSEHSRYRKWQPQVFLGANISTEKKWIWKNDKNENDLYYKSVNSGSYKSVKISHTEASA